MQSVASMLVCLLSMIFAVMSLTMAMHQSSEVSDKIPGNASPSQRLMKGKDNALKLMMRPSISSEEMRRHIRSVDPQDSAQSNEQLFEGDESTIQSNSRTDDEPELTHKTLRSVLPSDVLRYIPQAPLSAQGKNKYGLNRWYFPGFSDFSRGGRADSNFIRFGRNANFNSPSSGLVNSNNANKKNNFIRLGRENPRQNNFIRLGRSGIWGNDDRYGSKIGFFPDYYSNLSGGRSIGDFAPPLPYDTTDVFSSCFTSVFRCLKSEFKKWAPTVV